MKTIKIGLLETNPATVTELRETYKAVFRSLGYEPAILHFDATEPLLVALEQENFHVLISDLSLGNKQTFNGLDFIRELRCQYPDMLFIGNTSGDLGYRVTETKAPNFHIFVDKSKLFENDTRYCARLKERIVRRFQKNTSIESVRIKGKKRDQFENSTEFRSILEQVTFTTHDPDSELSISHIEVTPLTAGKSGSRVYKLLAETPSNDFRFVPTVLKISSREDARTEHLNYKSYVQWVLPYLWRPELVNHGETRNHGAVLYSFVIPPDEEFNALTKYIKNGSMPHVETAICNIFGASNRSWYNDSLVGIQENLNERYNTRYFYGRDITDTAAKSVIRSLSADHKMSDCRNGVLIDGEEYPHPFDQIFGRPFGAHKSCIQHGDLNSNNIIISDDAEKLIFIDFQDTGRGHVFEDFICFEYSLRLHLPFRKESAKSWLGKEKLLANGKDCGSRYFGSILKVRELAFETFGKEKNDIRAYMYGAASFGMRLMRMSELDERQKYRVSCAVVSSCKMLDDMST